MKKWYVITGILVLLLLISIGSCVGNSIQVDSLKAELHTINETSARDLETANESIAKLTQELTQLKATKEFSFGNGLKVFDLSLPKDVWSSVVSGKVQNISSESMKLVYIMVAAYDGDGTLKDIGLDQVYDLYPNEVGEWTAYPGYADSYAVYAFGNR